VSVTPLHYTPAPAPVVDRAHAVIDLLPVYLDLAGRVAATEFVPKALRNRPEAVLAALMSGAERGLGPMESLRSINIIEGTPSLSAQAMRGLVLAAGHDLDIIESTATRCTMNGRRAGSDHTTTFTWTTDRARRARLINKDNWQRYPENMLLARATSELCNAIFADVVMGLAVTEVIADELAPEPTTSRRAPARRQLAPSAAGPQAGAESGRIAGSIPAPPQPPATVIDTDTAETADGIPGADTPTWGSPAPAPEPAPAHDPSLARRIHAEIAKAFPDATAETRDRWRHALVAVVTRRRPDGPATSSSDLDLEEQLALSELLTRTMGGQATVADGPDDTIELRAGGGWRYTITLDPPAVAVRQGDAVIEATADEGTT